MHGIVLLFKSKTLFESKEFVYRNIDRKKLTIEGVSNEVYSQRISVTRCWGEAKRFFSSKQESDKMTVHSFYILRLQYLLHYSPIGTAYIY